MLVDDNGRLRGLFTDSDLARLLEQHRDEIVSQGPDGERGDVGIELIEHRVHVFTGARDYRVSKAFLVWKEAVERADLRVGAVKLTASAQRHATRRPCSRRALGQ